MLPKIPNRQTAVLQRAVYSANEIGERVPVWHTFATLGGVLDMSSGGTNYSTFNAKFMESTHVFLTNYNATITGATNCRALICGAVYDVTMIDNPCGLNDHLEIYLTFKGVA